MDNKIAERVHQLYWDLDINCARTTLFCLGELFNMEIGEQIKNAAIGLHGAGGYRAQCGLVEGALMFIGIYFANKGKSDSEISHICYQFAEKFEYKFGSMSCFDLRPSGFTEHDPPHACEKLTVDAAIFSCDFINDVAFEDFIVIPTNRAMR